MGSNEFDHHGLSTQVNLLGKLREACSDSISVAGSPLIRVNPMHQGLEDPDTRHRRALPGNGICLVV